MPRPHQTISSRSSLAHDASNPRPSMPSRSFGKPTEDAFRPNLLGLPKDPFAAKPWIVNLDALPSSHTQQIILVLGTPPDNDLHALIHSEALQNSLLLIATHDVKPFASLVLLSPTEPNSPTTGPTTRILRLGSPLFPSTSAPGSPRAIGSSHGLVSTSTSSLPSSRSSGGGSDALRVMSLLNRASQIASSLKLSDHYNASVPRIQQLGENPSTGEFNVVEVLGSAFPASVSISPSQQSSFGTFPGENSTNTPKKSKRQALHNFFSFGSSPSSSSPLLKAKPSNAEIQRSGISPTAAIFRSGSPSPGGGVPGGQKATRGPGGGRAFDALINYLPSPSSIPEKVILKQAILITTLSAPYLSGAGAPTPATFDKLKEKKHVSLLGIPLSRRSTSIASARDDFSPKSHGGKNATIPTSRSSTREGTSWEGVEIRERCNGPAHLLHVIPESRTLFGSGPTPAHQNGHRSRDIIQPTLAKPKLVTSIEQFVLAFAFPVALSLKSPALASASTSLSSIKGKESFSSTSNSTSALPRSHSSNLMPTMMDSGSHLQPAISSNSLIEDLNGKPVPYVIKAGVLGGMFSMSLVSEGRTTVRTVSISDLLLFGALDGSIEEHGGGKAWLGGVGVREVVESLGGRVQGGVEVRYTAEKMPIENLWIGAEADDPRAKRKEQQKPRSISPTGRRRTLSKTPSSSSSGGASASASSDAHEHVHRTLSKVARKPAPTLTPSDSMTAAWNALQSKVNSRSVSTPSAEYDEPKGVGHGEHRDRDHGGHGGRRPRRESEKKRSTQKDSHSRSRRTHLHEDEAYVSVEIEDDDPDLGRERERDERRHRRKEKDAEETRHKRKAWDTNTGLLTPPGSSSEKEAELESRFKRRGSEKRYQDAHLHPPEPVRSSPSRPSADRSRSHESGRSISGQEEESFDFAQAYQYDRSRCPDRQQDHQRNRDDRDRVRENLREGSREEDHSWQLRPEKERTDGRVAAEVDYMRGGMGPPSPSKSGRGREYSHGHHHGVTGNGSRRGDGKRSPEQEREVYYFSNGGKNWEGINTTAMATKDAVEYAKTLYRGNTGQCSLAGVPPVGHDYASGLGNESQRERKSSRASSLKYHYTKANDSGQSDGPAPQSDDKHRIIPRVKRKSSAARLGELVGRVLPIKTSPESPSPRHRRLSVVQPVAS